MACGINRMMSLYDGYDYYKKLFELQERLRKSEEERIRLEERFNILMRESRNRHDSCINRLRMRYIQYLEEQRTRDERNYKLLATLDRVTNKLTLINVKKDRLNVLRKQYETHLLRVYANRRPLGSTTGDSGIASQNEEKYARKAVPLMQSNLNNTSVKVKNLSSLRTYSEVPQLDRQSSRSIISQSKLNDQTVANDVLLNNLPTLPIISLGSSLDYQETHIPRDSHTSPIGRSSDLLLRTSIFAPDGRQYRQAVPDGITIPNLRIPIMPLDRFPSQEIASRIDPATLLRYRDVIDSQPLIAKYDPSDEEAPSTDANKIRRVCRLPRHLDTVLTSPRRLDDEGSPSFTSDDMNELLMGNNERPLWRNSEMLLRRSPIVSGINDANCDADDDATGILECELDRYISNIRRLHREHGVVPHDASEDVDREQNTSGDLLNVTLSENVIEDMELPADQRMRRDAKRTATSIDEPENDVGKRHQDDASFDAKSEDEERTIAARSEVGEDTEVAIESKQLRNNTSDDRKVSTKKNDAKEKRIASSKIDDQKHPTPKEKWLELVIGKESNMDGFLDTIEELAPWSIASVQKNVRELRPVDSVGIQMTRTATNADETEIAGEDKRDSPRIVEITENASPPLESTAARRGIDETHEVENVINSPVEMADRRKIDEIDVAARVDDESRTKNDDGTTRLLGADEQTGSGTYENGEYGIEQGYKDLNHQREENRGYYGEEIAYEEANEDYGGYADQTYVQKAQGYIEYNGQYERYPEEFADQRYEQYQQDPNQQYDYNYDPNQGYDPNQQYDSNQEYGNPDNLEDSNRQYDPNQEYGSPDNLEDPNSQYDPNQEYGSSDNPTQAYDYVGQQQAYDPDQTYEGAYEQENVTERCDHDATDMKECKGKSVTEEEEEEAARKKMEPNEEYKSEKEKGECKADVNGANQSTKKKDVIKSLLDSDTDTTIERNVSNTESDFDFN